MLLEHSYLYNVNMPMDTQQTLKHVNVLYFLKDEYGITIEQFHVEIAQWLVGLKCQCTHIYWRFLKVMT